MVGPLFRPLWPLWDPLGAILDFACCEQVPPSPLGLYYMKIFFLYPFKPSINGFSFLAFKINNQIFWSPWNTKFWNTNTRQCWLGVISLLVLLDSRMVFISGPSVQVCLDLYSHTSPEMFFKCWNVIEFFSETQFITMGEVELEMSTRAYCKMMMHAARYPSYSINGLLLSKSSSMSSGSKLIQYLDCIPLFHINTGLAPMVEVALAQVLKDCSVLSTFYLLSL